MRHALITGVILLILTGCSRDPAAEDQTASVPTAVPKEPQPTIVSNGYVLRTPVAGTNYDVWDAVLVSDANGMARIDAWVAEHESELAAVNNGLFGRAVLPGTEVFHITTDGIRSFWLATAVHGPGPKRDAKRIEIMSAADLEEVKAIFEQHGVQTDWMPPEDGSVRLYGVDIQP